MRWVAIVVSGLVLALCAAGGSLTAVASGRHTTFTAQAAALQKEWTKDIGLGVPAASIAPLRKTLQQSANTSATWWSPHWWGNTGDQVISDLRKKTSGLWTAAMSAGRTQATAAVKLWSQLSQQLSQYIPADASSDAATWAGQVTSASTPMQLTNLSRAWLADIADTRTKAQANELNAQVSDYGGVSGLLDDARSAVGIAGDDNLDTGDVPDLIDAVANDYQDNIVQNADATSAVTRLVNADSTLRSLIALNDNVNSLIRPIELSVDQAAAEGTPNSASFQTQYQGVQQSFHDATTTTALSAVQAQLNAIQTAVNTDLAANVCGHNVGAGKVLTFNLALQEGVFYQDGCVVKATPVTTGRPELRTPTGTFSIFYKTSPFQFISPWPVDSPFYYYPSWSQWVMEFAQNGFFIHDASWEPDWLYGPGGEDSSGASHGCIHIPTDTMQWLYGWTANGTPVIIS